MIHNQNQQIFKNNGKDMTFLTLVFQRHMSAYLETNPIDPSLLTSHP